MEGLRECFNTLFSYGHLDKPFVDALSVSLCDTHRLPPWKPHCVGMLKATHRRTPVWYTGKSNLPIRTRCGVYMQGVPRVFGKSEAS